SQKWEGISTLCRDFIDKCLVKAPGRRITAEKAQGHPWLKKARAAMEQQVGPPLSRGALLAMRKFQTTSTFKK
ncbi:unnamed protein product, partial [Discosporangium mesarthrocarpum]